MPPRSKRQRKQRDKISLKGKQRAIGQNLLDPDHEDPNALILSSSKSVASYGAVVEGPSDSSRAQAAPSQQRVSKSQQRKLRKIQEEKERRVKRAKVMETLAKHHLDGEELRLLRPVAARGQKESKKESLRRALQLHRAGIEFSINPEVQLFKERHTDTSEDNSSSEEETEAIQGKRSDGNSVLPITGAWNERRHNIHLRSNEFANQDLDRDQQPFAKEETNHETPVASMDDIRHAITQTKRELGEKLLYREDDEENAHATSLAQSKLQVTAYTRGQSPRVVFVERSANIESVRSNLPIISMEQEIMESISENDVVILCGETGCGKTTQVPQFLYEAGYGSSLFPERSGSIGVTQPRRVAAVSTAGRVAEELGSPLGELVGYQVRYDKKIGSQTALKFMTDGILLREVQEDFLLSKYSAIIVDEAHERSLNTDILLGMLSRISSLRRTMSLSDPSIHPLKLIIMSATLRIEDFAGNQRLFSVSPPVVRVPARQYPVTVHFSRKTELHDYIGAAYKKVCQVHRNLPPGGVLVFVTGQREVEYLCRKLRDTFKHTPNAQNSSTNKENEKNMEIEIDGNVGGPDAAEIDAGAAIDEDLFLADIADNGDDFGADEDGESGGEEDVVVFGGEGLTKEEMDEAEQKFEKTRQNYGSNADQPPPVHVLPLYAMLPPAQQSRVFQPPPPGARLIVVATNVAETSLTIPGIRYVVDSGRSKQRILESSAGLARFDVRWISKASAEQRAGRAGRTGPGHCYRLYSSAHFNDTFPQHTPPEIVNTSLEGVALSLKSLGIDKVANFPFPTPPEMGALAAAERCLTALGSLDPTTGRLTDLGMAMSKFPISPRHARMLLEVVKQCENVNEKSSERKMKKEERVVTPEELIYYAQGLAAVMSVESPFVHVGNVYTDGSNNNEHDMKNSEAAKAAHAFLRVPESDALSALNALIEFEKAGESDAFCRTNFLLFKNLREAAALRKQLARLINYSKKNKTETTSISQIITEPPPPAALQALRKAITAGWADQVARRVRSIEYLAKQRQGECGENVAKNRAVKYKSCSIHNEDVFLHPNSGLHKLSPEYVVYTEVVRSVKRPYMAGLTAIEPQWLSSIAPSMCVFSSPLLDPPPFYNTAMDGVLCWQDVTFGAHNWPLPRHASLHPDKKERCAVFAHALLDGKVLPSMSSLKSCMALPPAMVAKPEMRVHRRVADLIDAMKERNICSKASLLAAWNTDPNFLRPELETWMQRDKVGVLQAIWKVLLQEVSETK